MRVLDSQAAPFTSDSPNARPPRVLPYRARAKGHFHILSFEGPDAYARAGGLASRVTGLSEALATLGFETELWFIGDPKLPPHEPQAGVQLHRWCQWISAYHPGGVYDGELVKLDDYAASLPGYLLPSVLADVAARRPVTILAEEWQTTAAVLGLDALLRARGVRDRVRIFWNANNTFGFERVDWARLARAATITTVSRYMKHTMQALGIDALVIPNGLEPTAYAPVDARASRVFRHRTADRLVLAKLARFDPDKRWLGAIDTLAALKRRKLKPLLIARGGVEAHGHEVLERARQHGLVVSKRSAQPGAAGMNDALHALDGVDIIQLTSHVGPDARRLLFHGAAGVLANSSHEPFGLVGLEAMAAGGVACTGISGEDYAVPGHNAIVLQTGAAHEAVSHLERLRADPAHERALRREGVATARKFSWASVIERNLIPQLELLSLELSR